MWWVIGALASFIVLSCYCSCVLAGRADQKKSEWLSREEEGTLRSIPPEKEFRDARRSGVRPSLPPNSSALLPFGSGLVGVRKNI